jgi:hypothetical protein
MTTIILKNKDKIYTFTEEQITNMNCIYLDNLLLCKEDQDGTKTCSILRFFEVFEMIKNNKVNFDSSEDILEGLSYFGYKGDILGFFYEPLLKHRQDKTDNFFQMILDKHEYRMDWEIWDNLCRNNGISEDFFKKILNSKWKCKIDWCNLCRNNNISEDFYRPYIGKTYYKNLHDGIKGKYKFANQREEREEDDWILDRESLSQNNNITGEIFKDILKIESDADDDEDFWQGLCRNNNLTEDFLNWLLADENDYGFCLEYNSIGYHNGLSEEYISYLLENNRIDICIFFKNNALSDSFFKKYKDHVQYILHRKNLFCNNNLSGDFFKELLSDKLFNTYDDWDELCMNNNLTEEFYRWLFSEYEFKDKIDGYCLFYNNNLSEDFFKWFMTNPYKISDFKINWKALCENNGLSDDFFRWLLASEYKNKIDWEFLCKNNNLTEDFFKELLNNPEYKDKIHWDSLCENNNLSQNFFKELINTPGNKINFKNLCNNNFMSLKKKEDLYFWNPFVKEAIKKNKNIRTIIRNYRNNQRL